MSDRASEEKLADILQPSPQADTFRVTVVFGVKAAPNYAHALEIARRNASYKEDGSGEWLRHSATYTPAEVDDLFELFNLVSGWDDTEVLVNNRNLPYGTSLWLPLMWFYRIK
jgi:hypothetical protein